QRPAHNAAQYVPATFVAGDDTVHDQEGTRTDVVGDDLQGVVFQIADPGFARRRADQVLEQVYFVVGMHALQHGGNALEAHAGVDTGLGQRFHVAGGIALELHENEVPDFDVAIAVFFGRTRRAAPHGGSGDGEHFGARAARTRPGRVPGGAGR